MTELMQQQIIRMGALNCSPVLLPSTLKSLARINQWNSEAMSPNASFGAKAKAAAGRIVLVPFLEVWAKFSTIGTFGNFTFLLEQNKLPLPRYKKIANWCFIVLNMILAWPELLLRLAFAFCKIPFNLISEIVSPYRYNEEADNLNQKIQNIEQVQRAAAEARQEKAAQRAAQDADDLKAYRAHLGKYWKPDGYDCPQDLGIKAWQNIERHLFRHELEAIRGGRHPLLKLYDSKNPRHVLRKERGLYSVYVDEDGEFDIKNSVVQRRHVEQYLKERNYQPLDLRWVKPARPTPGYWERRTIDPLSVEAVTPASAAELPFGSSRLLDSATFHKEEEEKGESMA
jgi:hypothetical protein